MKKIKECMNTEVISVKRSTSLKEILAMFKTAHCFPLLPVISEENTLIGIVSLTNLIQIFQPYHYKLFHAIPFLEEKEEIFEVALSTGIEKLLLAEDIMDSNFVAVSDEEEINKAFKLMRLHNLELLPVINSRGALVGMIGIFDVIRNAFAEQGIT